MALFKVLSCNAPGRTEGWGGGGKKYIRRESLLSGPRFDPVFSLVRPRNINTFLQLAVVLLQV